MPKALVTGGSGFIGSSLIRQLAEKGYEVRALLRKTSDTSHLEGVRFERADGDLSNAASLKKAVEGVDLIFHLAGVVRAPNREGFFKHNADGTRLLAEAIAEVTQGLSVLCSCRVWRRQVLRQRLRNLIWRVIPSLLSRSTVTASFKESARL